MTAEQELRVGRDTLEARMRAELNRREARSVRPQAVYEARVRQQRDAALAPSRREACGCAPGVRCFVELGGGSWGVCAFDHRVGRRCSACTGDATRSASTLDELLARDA